MAEPANGFEEYRDQPLFDAQRAQRVRDELAEVVAATLTEPDPVTGVPAGVEHRLVGGLVHELTLGPSMLMLAGGWDTDAHGPIDVFSWTRYEDLRGGVGQREVESGAEHTWTEVRARIKAWVAEVTADAQAESQDPVRAPRTLGEVTRLPRVGYDITEHVEDPVAYEVSATRAPGGGVTVEARVVADVDAFLEHLPVEQRERVLEQRSSEIADFLHATWGEHLDTDSWPVVATTFTLPGVVPDMPLDRVGELLAHDTDLHHATGPLIGKALTYHLEVTDPDTAGPSSSGGPGAGPAVAQAGQGERWARIAELAATLRAIPTPVVDDEGPVGEYLIPVVFDVNADTEGDAARFLADRLAETVNPVLDSAVESWWYPLAEHKHIDRNDRDPYLLVPDNGTTPRAGSNTSPTLHAPTPTQDPGRELGREAADEGVPVGVVLPEWIAAQASQTVSEPPMPPFPHGVPTPLVELVVDDENWSVHFDLRAVIPAPDGGEPAHLYVWVRNQERDHEWTGPVPLPDTAREQTVVWAHRVRQNAERLACALIEHHLDPVLGDITHLAVGATLDHTTHTSQGVDPAAVAAQVVDDLTTATPTSLSPPGSSMRPGLPGAVDLSVGAPVTGPAPGGQGLTPGPT